MPYSSLILLHNLDTDAEELAFAGYVIRPVTDANWENLKKIFSWTVVFRSGQHYMRRDYEAVPPSPEDDDPSGFGAIPYDSEDAMLLLRLFKPGDLVFLAQVIKGPDGQTYSQYRYPQVFSSYHSPFPYSLRAPECSELDLFCREAPTWAGWRSPWFKMARRYFLWGSSKELNIQRARRDQWELERILDFFIALEAALVPENDFVSRRLRQRTARLLASDSAAADSFKTRIGRLYGVRSALAHGGTIGDEIAQTLAADIQAFEADVRKILRAALQHAVRDETEEARVLRLQSLFDVSDENRANKLTEDWRSIRSQGVREELIGQLRRETVEGKGRTALAPEEAGRAWTLGDLLTSGLAGLWSDRTDIRDSVEFTRALREAAERRARAAS